MGLFANLFRKKSNIPLLEEGKSEEKQIKKDKVDVQIFSKKTGGDIEYSIRMVSDGEEINVGTISNIDGQSMQLKSVAKEIQGIVSPLVEDKRNYPLNVVKEQAKHNLKKIAGNNKIALSEQVMDYITEYKPINYEKLESLPREVDISKLSNDEKMRIGQKLQSRLDKLDTIKTPDDAYEDRENLIFYMQDRENVPSNPIVEASLQSEADGITLDEDTVLRIAENMEEINNEDGALYSIYLKIEEKRIWKQLQTRIAQYSNDSKDEAIRNEIYKLSALLKELDKYEIKDINGGLSSEILNYIINQMKEMDIVTYTQRYKEADALLARFINTNYSDIPDKQQILQFLYARIGSLGQLSNRNLKGNNGTLRNFVINTDFKHEDNQETKEFLLLVAKIEKEYIKSEYEQIIDIYKEKKASEMTFKDRLNATDSLASRTDNKVKQVKEKDDNIQEQ